MKKIGVIILNWNGLKLLQQFVPDAAKHCISENSDLIVADNGSTDASLAWLAESHPEVKRIALPENYGFAEGYNRAIAACGDEYEYVVLLNSDVLTTEGWTTPLLEYFETHPEVGAAQPKILSWHERDRFEYAGAAGGYLDALGYPYCRGRLFDSIERDEGQYDGEPVDVCWASGAALMVRVKAYREVGGLDPRFFAHMEEIDLCCRMHAAGWRVVADGRSAVYHVGGASLSASNPRKTYLNFRNNLLLLHKNLPRRRGRRMLLVRRLADTLAFGMFLAKGRWGDARAVVKAHGDFRRMRKHYTDLPDRDVLSTLPGARRKILIDYYIKRKKK